jgi:hypothetical protein
MSLAFRAGIQPSQFWSMTAHQVVVAFGGRQEDMSRLAWRTAYFHRVSHKHFPKNEEEIFRRPGAAKQRQTLGQQLAMAKLITRAMQR